MLTGDQNIVDIAYSVRWNIRDPELYLFELAQPDETIRQVGESAMRAVVSGFSLNDTIGEGRGDIETRVQDVMQSVLNTYRAGVRIQGIAIKQADPPEAVNDAFKEVSAAQQEAQSYINQARAYALQLTAKAQGEATAFDKVYEHIACHPTSPAEGCITKPWNACFPTSKDHRRGAGCGALSVASGRQEIRAAGAGPMIETVRRRPLMTALQH